MRIVQKPLQSLKVAALFSNDHFQVMPELQIHSPKDCDLLFLDTLYIDQLSSLDAKEMVLCDFKNLIDQNKFSELTKKRTLSITKPFTEIGFGVETEILPPSFKSIDSNKNTHQVRSVGYIGSEVPNAGDYRGIKLESVKDILEQRPDCVMLPNFKMEYLPFIVAALSIGALLLTGEDLPSSLGIEPDDEYLHLKKYPLDFILKYPHYFSQARAMARIRAINSFDPAANLERLIFDRSLTLDR